MDEPTTRDAVCDEHGPYLSKRSQWGYEAPTWQGCPECVQRFLDERRARHEAAQQQELSQKRLAALLKHAGKRFADATFDTFNARSAQQIEAVATCRAFAASVKPDRGDGLLLLGTPGTGKTHLMVAALREVIVQRGLGGVFVSARELVRDLRSTWRRDSEADEAEVIDFYGNVDVLGLDDLGAGFGSAAEHLQLLDVIDARYRQQRPTIVTSNLGGEDLREAVRARAFDRLRDGAQIVAFTWPSHRKPA